VFDKDFPKRPWTDSEKWILGIVAAMIIFFSKELIGTVFSENNDCHLPWQQQKDAELCYQIEK